MKAQILAVVGGLLVGIPGAQGHSTVWEWGSVGVRGTARASSTARPSSGTDAVAGPAWLTIAPAAEVARSLLPHPHTPTLPHGFAAADPAVMTIAQLQYDGGGDWYANPTGLPNLLVAIRARTGIPVADRPAHVKIGDPELWQYPYLYMTGHGNVHFSDEDVRILRQYLSTGGFLHADDNYGMDRSFRREIERIFPGSKLVELPKDHPIYHDVYDFPRGLPKVHKHDGLPAQGFGIFHDGRLVVFYDYQCDLGNGWEDPQTYGDPPALHEAALRMGVNLFTFAMSQVTR